MKTTRGFTLIELMIVVAIIAILASIAITVYNNSIGKAELSEAFTVVDGLKTDVAEYYSQAGSCPSNGSGSIGAPASYSGKYVASATVGSGVSGCTITATMRSTSVSVKLQGKQVLFSMSPAADGNFTWSCSTDAPATFTPTACK